MLSLHRLLLLGLSYLLIPLLVVLFLASCRVVHMFRLELYLCFDGAKD